MFQIWYPPGLSLVFFLLIRSIAFRISTEEEGSRNSLHGMTLGEDNLKEIVVRTQVHVAVINHSTRVSSDLSHPGKESERSFV